MDERSRRRIAAARIAPLLLIGAIAGSQAGCSLFVMAGKMFEGELMQPAAFRTATKINLAKEAKRVVVVCSTPEAMKGDFPSLEFDMVEQITRTLKSNGVTVINPDDVAKWMDDHGGYSENPRDLANHFDVDLVIHADLSQFSYREDNSPTLFRGRANGNVRAYQVVKQQGGKKRVQQVFVSEYVSVYPKLNPISTEQMTETTFRKRYLDHVCEQIAQLFYDHRASEEME